MNNNISQISASKAELIIWTLLLLMPIIGMAVDLIAPSLPAIAEGLHIASHTAQNVISIYLLGYAISNLLTGFLTDAWGRKHLMRINLLGFIIASFLPVVFPQIEVLLLSRFLQGITIGAVAVVARATFSDILPPEKLIRFGTLIGTMWGLGPVIGPILGGYLQHYFGWKAGFCFFSLITFLLFIPIFHIVSETHFNRNPLRIKIILGNLSEIYSSSLFIGIVVMMGLAYSLLIVFNTMAPFLIQKQWGYSPIFFGHLSLFLGCIFLLSTFICRHYIKQYEVETLYFIVIHAALLFLVVLFFLALFYNR
jgi:MFS transporter, DHA1 family, multidrug resistance protein